MAPPFPSLILRRGGERVLVVADLHIGWEASLVRVGVHIPSQVDRLLRRLEELVDRYAPTSLIFLGDVKHTVAWAEAEERWGIREMMKRLLELVPNVQVIPGNHDGNIERLLPDEVRILPSTGIPLWGEYGLFHGHAWPSPELLGCRVLIQGHVHPVVAFRGAWFRVVRQVWVRARCQGDKLARLLLRRLGVRVGREEPRDILKDLFGVELQAKELVIMPSFNDFLGGQPVNVEESRWGDPTLLGPIPRSGAVDIEGAEVYLLDGTLLGSIRQLRGLKFR